MKTLIIALFGVTACAQNTGLQERRFEGQPALVLANGKLELLVLPLGASFASVALLDDPGHVNPLWNPARLQRELGRGDVMTSGATGHFVCVDGFGPTSAEERAAGLPGHGEAHRQKFQVVAANKRGATNTVALRATLPLVQEVLTRTLRMVDGENVVYVESQLENQLPFDRPVNWAEHATIGSPFLEPGATVLDLSGSRSRTRPYTQPPNGPMQRRLTSGQDFTWPMAPAVDGTTVDLRHAPADAHYLDHAVTLLDPARPHAWVTALHIGQRLLLGYLFLREEYPWLQYWGNYPPNGKLARGLEFSTQPFDVPRREAVGMGSLFDTPTYRWLPAKAKIQSHFLLFYVRVPEGFRKVDDVRLEGGEIVVEDRTAQRQVKLAASLGLTTPGQTRP